MPAITRISAALALVAGIGLTSLMSAQASPAPVAHATAAHAPNDQITATTLVRFNAKLTALTKAHKFSGTVLVAQGNTVLLRKGYGMADWSHQIHNTSATEFINDSLVQDFSAVAVLQLEDAGKLRDQDHLCTYLPHCPATWSSITIHELLNDTDGIHDVEAKPTLGETNGDPYTLAQVVGYAMREPMEHRPGSREDSDGVTQDVVREFLVEQVSGASFGAYVQEHLLRPLGLQHTGYYLHTPPILPLADGYQSWQVPTSLQMTTFDMSAFGGGVYSTVDDSFRWERAMDTGRLLAAASTAKLLTASYTACHTLAQCGSGETSRGRTEGVWFFTWQGHSATDSGFIDPWEGTEQWTHYYTDARVTVIFLTNQAGSSKVAGLADRLLFM